MHPLSTGLALLILAQRMTFPTEAVSTTLAIVLERYLPKWEDERVADLDARILQRLNPLDEEERKRFFVVARLCSEALGEHDDAWEMSTT